MSRSGKTLTVLGLVLAGVVVVVFAAAAWYFAGMIENQGLVVEHEPDLFDLRVVAIAAGRITLDATAAVTGRWNKSGTWGLESADTYNQVGRIVEADADSVVRELIALGPLPQVGESVGIDRDAFPGNPWHAHGTEFQEVDVPAALGALPAWLTRG